MGAPIHIQCAASKTRPSTSQRGLIVQAEQRSRQFGILRMVTSDPDKSLNLLKNRGFSVNLTDVLAISTPAEAGRFAQILQCFSSEKISIEYMYAFSIGKTAYLILRTDDSNRALDVVAKNGLQLVTYDDLKFL